MVSTTCLSCSSKNYWSPIYDYIANYIKLYLFCSILILTEKKQICKEKKTEDLQLSALGDRDHSLENAETVAYCYEKSGTSLYGEQH